MKKTGEACSGWECHASTRRGKCTGQWQEASSAAPGQVEPTGCRWVGCSAGLPKLLRALDRLCVVRCPQQVQGMDHTCSSTWAAGNPSRAARSYARWVRIAGKRRGILTAAEALHLQLTKPKRATRLWRCTAMSDAIGYRAAESRKEWILLQRSWHDRYPGELPEPHRLHPCSGSHSPSSGRATAPLNRFDALHDLARYRPCAGVFCKQLGEQCLQGWE